MSQVIHEYRNENRTATVRLTSEGFEVDLAKDNVILETRQVHNHSESYAEDVADGVILTIMHGTGNQDFLNLGSGEGYTIKQLVENLSTVENFNYRFDTTKNSGFPRRIMNIENAKKIIGYEPKVTLKDGLKKTWNWYIKNKNENDLRHNYFKDDK